MNADTPDPRPVSQPSELTEWARWIVRQAGSGFRPCPSEDGPADEGAEPVHEHGPLSWHETPNLMAWRCDVCGTFPVDIHS